MITWEPWNPADGSVNQPKYALSTIIAGTWDAYITRWATEIKQWGRPLLLRFAHEMNGTWYPWAEGVNGNTAGQYVAAWRHVHDIFTRVGTNNVSWVWSPNTIADGSPSLAELYPGDAYTDWVAVDGYNWGTTASWSSWQSFPEAFGPTLAALRQLSRHPIMIGETASTEAGGNKAQWIQGFFTALAANPDIRAFVWFNIDKETDWRIESSAAATTAFAQGVAAARYQAG
jgi:beta-mannanase